MFNMMLRAAVRSPLMAIGGIIMAVRLSLDYLQFLLFLFQL